ncbi:MAG: PIN domain-containing protein [Armatimonadetes bacterium]|nr:PIN domain-containing protein [Armatimonadota bacterium]
MSLALPDVNVLVALHWPNHPHHELAQEWFGDHGSAAWATCPITQLGFVRVGSNPSLSPGFLRTTNAWRWLKDIAAHPGHVFWPDDLDPRACPGAFSRVVGHKQFTDAYLLALARHHGGCLVTFDRGLRSLAEPGDEPATLLILEA